MKFCMVTTFFGPHSFGGDAAYVDRLSHALLGRGHQVDVVYPVDAFEAVVAGQPQRSYTAPPQLRVHALRHPLGFAGMLWIHQTGRSGILGQRIAKILREGQFDVVHFHNISLLGLDILRAGIAGQNPPPGAVRLMTAHEHWLTCPLSVLWKNGQEPCEQPSCFSCTLRAARPPQLWRSQHGRDQMLESLDALIVPSEHALAAHRRRGIRRAIDVLPYFLPDDSRKRAAASPPLATTGRPYFAAAGRLVKEKGFDELINQMRSLPQADLLIAGAGPWAAALHQTAAGLSNVRFLGLLSENQLWELYKGASAVVMPSRFYETFGFVGLEALAAGTPVIVRNRGALPDLIARSGAGDVFETSAQLSALLRLYLDPAHTAPLRARALLAVEEHWNQAAHLRRYTALVGSARTKPRE